MLELGEPLGLELRIVTADRFELLLHGIRNAELRQWHSTFVIDISETIEQKIASIQAYESQFDPERFAKVRHYVSSVNGYQGARCGFMYGELFALPHPVGNDDLMRVVLGGKGSLAPVQLPGQDHLPMN